MPYRKSKPWGSIKPSVGASPDWNDPINAGLVGSWLLSEGAGSIYKDATRIADASGAVVSTVGKFGRAISPNGAWLAAPVKGPTNGTTYTAFSAGGWANFATNAPDGAVISQLDGSFNGWMLWKQGASTFYRTYMNGGTRALSSVAIPFGEWHHIFTTWDGATVTLYQNGIPVGSGAYAVAPAAAFEVEIGAYSASFALSAGSLDTLRLYRRCLSPGEVMRLYRDPFAGITAPRRRIISAASAATGNLFRPSNLNGLQSAGPYFANPIG